MATTFSNLQDWHFSIDFEGIAWAIIDRKGESMNSLGRRPTEELAEIVKAVEKAAASGEVKGLVLMSAKDTSFIAGADIREFQNFDTEPKIKEVVRQTLELFDRIDRLPVTVVAAIHGYCLGGGLELALACDWRIADREEATRLGFPEVKLGIFPGLNGTVRSIELAGPTDAMTAMLTGRMLRPTAARAIGLVDQLVPTHHNLRWAARKAVLQKRRSKGAPWWKRLMLKQPVRSFLAKQMRAKTAEKVREEHYPAPFRLIDLFEQFGDDPISMRIAETEAFAPLMASETSRNLRRVFKLSEMLKDEAPKDGFKPRKVHVIGAGTMGGDIAAWCVVSGMQASLQDVDEGQIAKALSRAKGLFKRRLRTPTAINAAVSRLIADPKGKHIKHADVVIEAIVEKLEVKQKLFQELERQIRPGAVLATNTSSLRLEDIAKPLADPGRLVGLHFFNPVAQLPLVEVVHGEGTREEEVRKACTFVAAINKLPLVVKSCPGFLVNRVLAPYLMEAVRRYQLGEPREKIDQAALKFGMPMGPLELMDLVGLDIANHVGEELRLAPGTDNVLASLVRQGKLGKKTGEGFYVWEKGKPKREEVSYDSAELERLGRELVKPMLDETERALENNIVANADHVDAGVIFGTGFAPFRGGPVHYRRTQEQAAEATAAAA
ncbi:MAG TPA: 3-hydroxyacyl-CoA dehydrogenase NAD-binding domain-containing protein [Methyloceanibacter sp.]|jgi:3-hydroxyacyl-CoA dehydrogenase / enoyl-CoA hydratase / 3-hydroxybutyryl-CoA epimerase|nr:3-hydroxyacyl-CoA dehydrogenase NAD-binding domain-containing protein [Methyloceanibacter sp.]